MHICLALPYLELGGTESHAVTLAKLLAQQARVTLLAPTGAGEEGIRDLALQRIVFPRFDAAPLAAWKSFRRSVRELVENDRPDLIHVHGAHELALALPAAARDIPVVFTNHGYHGKGSGFSYRTAAWVCNRKVDQAIAVSEHERRRMARHGFRQDRLHLIHNGIDDPTDPARSYARISVGSCEESSASSSAQQSAPQSAGESAVLGSFHPRSQGGPDFVVGTVARLEAAKGIEWLVRAVARLSRQEDSAAKSARAVIVGSGSLEGELKELAEAAGAASLVRFAGYVPDASRLMSAFDLFVLPSIEEPFGLVCAEAMANRLPVVASAVGGIPEIVVDGETGLLVPPADEKALAEAIGRLAGDPSLAKRLGEAGRDHFLRHFTSEAMLAKTLAVYEKAIESKRRKGGR